MCELITPLISSALVSALVSGVVAFITREWIKKRIEHEYQKKLEGIRSEYAKELAALNSALQESRDFKATRLRLVYERKIAALCEGFGKLTRLEQCLGEYVTQWGSIRGTQRASARAAFASALQDFEGFFVPNRIFFPASLAEEITEVKIAMHNMATRYLELAESPGSTPSVSGRTWDQASDWTQQEFPRIRRRIEEQIRAELEE
jgi:hypothetical protein